LAQTGEELPVLFGEDRSVVLPRVFAAGRIHRRWG
jgi:hypothetical protein